ncbi:hypothetical protein ACFQUX_20915 [Pantoea stewartii]
MRVPWPPVSATLDGPEYALPCMEHSLMSLKSKYVWYTEKSARYNTGYEKFKRRRTGGGQSEQAKEKIDNYLFISYN